MLIPLLTTTDLTSCEFPDLLADALIGADWRTRRDAVARAIGHADDWESDGMGACASVVHLTYGEQLAYHVATALDVGIDPRESHSIVRAERALGRYVMFVRSDDHGFWDAIGPTTRKVADGYLSEWVAANVPVDEGVDL